MRFEEDYPASPPKVKLCVGIPHPNVFSDYICLDMLKPYTSTLPYSGWSNAYRYTCLKRNRVPSFTNILLGFLCFPSVSSRSSCSCRHSCLQRTSHKITAVTLRPTLIVAISQQPGSAWTHLCVQTVGIQRSNLFLRCQKRYVCQLFIILCTFD